MKRSILAIGGGGFIGSHVVRRLVASGKRVRVLDRNPGKVRANLEDLEEIEIVAGDTRNRADLAHAMRNVTDVVYLAHATVPATSMKDFHFDLDANLPPLLDVLQHFRDLRSARRFVYFSSGGTVYGEAPSRKPLSETSDTMPISSYGLTKLVAEHYIRIALSTTNVTSCVIRPSNAYGERQNLDRPQGAVGHFLKAVALDRPLVILGDGSTIRDYLYVGDLAEAAELCLNQKSENAIPFQTYNIGSGRGVSLNELVKLVEKVTGKAAIIKRRSSRTFDCTYNVLSCQAAQEELLWKPRTSLEEGLNITWDWIKRHC